MSKVARLSLALIALFFIVSFATAFGGLGVFFECFVQAPYMAVMFYGFYRVLSDGVHREGWRRIFLDILLLFSLMVFFIGYGLHFAANWVEVTMAENEFMLLAALKVATSPEALVYLYHVYAPVYYFDEILGHQLVYTGFFGLMVGGILLEGWYRKEEELTARDYAAITVSSAMLALITTFATVEGQYAVHALVFSSAVALALPACFKRQLVRKPFTLLIFLASMLTVMCLVTLAVMYFDPLSVALHGLAGRIPQPSEPKRILRQFIIFSGVVKDEWKVLLPYLI
ncbi:MAG: hypothetical protein QXX87_01750 [Candidatus Jordarchaeales archaeon]